MSDMSQEWFDIDAEWFEIDPLLIDEVIADMFQDFEDSESGLP